MNRRELLKRIGVSLPALVTVRSSSASTTDPASPDDFDYRGWQLRWRDWTYCVSQDTYIGLWTARGNGRYLYSAYPGGYGETSEGSLLDTSLEPWQHPTGYANAEQLDHYKSQALRRLKMLINQTGEP
jgi:hypothetical protein